MAGPLSIPPLHENDRIGDWRHLFKAAVTNLLAEENGNVKAIQLLPAYVNRRTAERELIKDLMRSMDNLDNTLDALEKTLDPPVDAFTSMQQLGKLHWEPGQEIDDFFYIAKRKAAHAGTGMKFLASIVASQLPRDVQARVKDRVKAIGDDLEGDQGRELIQVVKRELTEHGHPLNRGNRDFEGIAKVAVISKPETYPESASTSGTDNEEKPAPNIRNTVSYSRGFRRGQSSLSRSSTKRREGCYICGENHFW